ncbi:hypothetical protein [Nocardia thraciensis]
MFRPELSQPEKHPGTMAAGDAAFAALTDTIAEVTRAGALPAAEADTVAMALWALAHGRRRWPSTASSPSARPR